MDKPTLISFRPTSDSPGEPNPPIEVGTPVILVQQGRCLVGHYARTDDGQFPTIHYPTNAPTLEPAAREVIAEYFPELATEEANQVLTCPADLAAEMIWPKS